jgi:hypothetical protein
MDSTVNSIKTRDDLLKSIHSYFDLKENCKYLIYFNLLPNEDLKNESKIVGIKFYSKINSNTISNKTYKSKRHRSIRYERSKRMEFKYNKRVICNERAPQAA